MKNIKNIVFSLIVICASIMIGIPGVKADIDGTITDKNTGSTSSGSYGSAGWNNTIVGVKIIVYDDNMNVKKSGVVANKAVSSTYYTVPNKNKFNQASYSVRNENVLVNTSLPDNYLFGSNDTFINLHDKLTSNNYKLLKSLLTTIGASNLTGAKYIIVEPMFFIQKKSYSKNNNRHVCCQIWRSRTSHEFNQCGNGGCCEREQTLKLSNTIYKICYYDSDDAINISYGNNYFLTAFEFYKNNSNEFGCYRSGKPFTGISDCYSITLGRLATSLSVNQALSGKLNLPSSYTDTSRCIQSSNGGCAAGWFEYDAVVPPAGTKVIVKKIDAATKKGLQGAKLGLYQGTTKKYECTSGSDGLCTFNGVAPGTYKLKEITPPANYLLNTEEKQVIVVKGAKELKNITFENTKKPDFSIKKTDQDGKVLQGAKFSLYKNNAKTSYTCISDSKGICKFTNLDNGKYEIREDSAPANYIKSEQSVSLKIESGTVKSPKSMPVFKNTRKLGLEIKKTDDEGKPLQGAVFYLYKDTARTAYGCTSDASGICKFSNIPADGTKYTIKETKAPEGYSKSNATCTYTAKVGAIASCSKFVNQPSCVTLFNRANSDGKVTMPERIQIYKSLKSGGDDYRSLLNLANTTAEKACTKYTVPNHDTSGCFAGTNGVGNIFNTTNISNYNQEVSFNDNGKTVYGYCLITARFLPRVASSGSTYAGRMLISTVNAVTQSTLRSQCYLYTENNSNNVSLYTGSMYYPLQYDKYIKNVKVSGNHTYLKKTLEENIKEPYNYKNGSIYVSRILGYYYLPQVYVSNLSGKPVSSGCTNCTYLGRGLLSPLDSGVTNFSFNYNFKGKTVSGTCNYETVPQFITTPPNGEMNLEFRIIDTHNPFPGKTGNNTRKKGSNWNKSVYISSDKTMSLTNLIIKNAVNSYGVIPTTKKLKEPKYTITLLPSDISQIRKYNSNNKYNDYNFDCSSSLCINNFLSDLENGKIGNKTLTSKLVINDENDSGWKKEHSALYYLNDSGKKVTGWQTIDGFKYYFNSNGVAQTGLKTISGKKYYFDKDGRMKTGFVKYMGDWYYFGSDGAMLTDTQTLDGKNYHFYSGGVMAKGWYYYNFWRYYNITDNKGVLRTGWTTLTGQKYYFDPANDGRMSTGLKTINNKKYYFNLDGEMLTGWQAYDSKWHYFNSNGAMLTGSQTINGVKYQFNANGECTSDNC